MTAALRLLLGRAHTGKSERIRAELKAIQETGGRAILIVPEQYTYETERTLADALGGLIGVQVLSFERLCERVLSLSGQERPFLSAQGLRMVVRRAVLLHRRALRALGGVAGQAGFSGTMCELFSDFKRCGLSPDDLDAAAERLAAHPALADKLTDIAALYRDTEGFLAGRYITADDAMDATRALLPDSFVRGVPLYIDDIDRPNAQLYALMEALLGAASQVTVALRVDRREPRDADVFAPDVLISERLQDMADSLGAAFSVIDCMPQRSLAAAPAIAHLEQNLFACPIETYAEAPSGLCLYGASCRAREAEALADAVLAAAHGGLRYREMAVIASDMASYAPLVERAFRQRGIPLFLDRKRPVTSHAAADALLSAARAAAGGYRPADVLQLAKTGYTDAAADDVEELELYIRRAGLRGGALKQPLTGAHAPEGAERARAAVMAPLLTLGQGFSGKGVSDKLRALYEYLVTVNLSGRLSEQAEALRAEGRVSLMEEHAQVWRVLMELFEQLDRFLGGVSLSSGGFVSVLEEGLEAASIGVIPGTADAVLLGDYARTKCRSVRALFVIGVNEGLLPAARADDALINDAELIWLREAGLSVWNSTQQRAAMDRLDIYTAFSKATESVRISYAFMGDAGELAPSPIVGSLLAIFPNLRLESDLDDPQALPLCRAEGLSLLAGDLARHYAGSDAGTRLPSLMRCLGEDPDAAPRVERMLAAAAKRGGEESLNEADAQALFRGAAVMSASRLELFNRCPFRHFIRYGLRAAEEKNYEENAADFGAFYHSALEAFVREVQVRSLDWQTLGDDAVDEMMNALLPPIIAAHNGGIFLSSPRYRAALFLVIHTVKSGARAIARQISAGGFVPQFAECRFGPDAPFPPLPLITKTGEEAYLTGVIDRIDTAAIDRSRYYRIVDYKTGPHTFDFGAFIDGLSLQLPLYLAAAARLGNGRAGLYYMTIKPRLPSDGDDPVLAATEACRLHGLTLSDPRVVLMSDASLAGGSGLLDGVKGDGEGFTGSLCSDAQLNALLERALAIARASVGRMRAGRIEIRPIEGACQYCEYPSVCGFDPSLPGCKARRKRRIRRQEYFDTEGGGEG